MSTHDDLPDDFKEFVIQRLESMHDHMMSIERRKQDAPNGGAVIILTAPTGNEKPSIWDRAKAKYLPNLFRITTKLEKIVKADVGSPGGGPA